MARSRIHNFHVPLEEGLYKQLRSLAEKEKLPATTLAREAIELWLKQKARQERSRKLAEYATLAAGTPDDLDQELEQASLELLFSEQAHSDE